MGDSKKKASVACLLIFGIIFAILTLISLGAIAGLGAVSILNADVANENQFRTSFCDPADNSNIVWLYWMAGASAAIVPFSICGTIAACLLTTASKQIQTDQHGNIRNEKLHTRDDHTDAGVEMKVKDPASKEREIAAQQEELMKTREKERVDVVEGEDILHFERAPLQCFGFGAMIAVFIGLFFISIAILCMLWSIAIAYDNARTPNKTITLYIVVDFLVGVLMPLLLIVSAAVLSVFLEYITNGRIDTRDVITKMLSIRLMKGEKAEYWVIQNIFFFELSRHDTEVRREPSKRTKRLSCPAACSQTPATWILAVVASLSFLFAVSYFIDQTITMQRSLQSLPHESERNEIDCFSVNPYIYYSPNEQIATDLLHNCTQFYERCEQGCVDIVKNCMPAGNCTTQFQECAESCAPCIGGCIKGLQNSLRRLSFCNPPVTSFSCPQPLASCIIPGMPAPAAPADCSDVVDIDVEEGDIGAISATLNSERLDQCTSLLTNCTALVHNCQTSDCEARLELCLERLRACRRPTSYLCFQFLEFGRSTNLVEAIAEAFALYLSVLAFFSGTFVAVRVLLQFHTTRYWGVGFIAVALVLLAGWVVVIVTDILVQENVIKMFQFVYGCFFILLIGILLLTAKFWERVPAPKAKESVPLRPINLDTKF